MKGESSPKGGSRGFPLSSQRHERIMRVRGYPQDGAADQPCPLWRQAPPPFFFGRIPSRSRHPHSINGKPFRCMTGRACRFVDTPRAAMGVSWGNSPALLGRCGLFAGNIFRTREGSAIFSRCLHPRSFGRNPPDPLRRTEARLRRPHPRREAGLLAGRRGPGATCAVPWSARAWYRG